MGKQIWSLVPNKSIGNLFFGEDQKIVRSKLGREYQPYRKTIFSRSTTDAYADYHVFYSQSRTLDAVEIFDNTVVTVNGSQVFPGTISQARKYISDLAYESGSYISKKYSIGLYAPAEDGDIEAILVARENYYE